MAVPASDDDLSALRWDRAALMDTEKIIEQAAIQTALRMPLGSMVSLILQGEPCQCHAKCYCDMPIMSRARS